MFKPIKTKNTLITFINHAKYKIKETGDFTSWFWNNFNSITHNIFIGKIIVTPQTDLNYISTELMKYSYSNTNDVFIVLNYYKNISNNYNEIHIMLLLKNNSKNNIHEQKIQSIIAYNGIYSYLIWYDICKKMKSNIYLYNSHKNFINNFFMKCPNIDENLECIKRGIIV